MDSIGLPGGIFILVVTGIGLVVFVGVPLWAAFDIYRSRDTISYWWARIAVIIVTIPFGIGALLGIAHLITKPRKPGAT